MHLFALFDEEDRAAHVADLADRHAAVEQLGHGDEDFLAHAVGNHVGAAVHEQGAAHPVVPVVVVRKAAQRRLQPAEDDRNIAVGLADAVGIDDGGAVGAQSRLAAGGIVVVGALLLRGGVMRDHGVDVARADEEAEARPPERAERLRRAEVRLCQKADAEARVLEHARDDRRAEGRMIHIGVAVDVDEIDLAPAPRLHLGAVHRQKLLFHHDKNSGETFLAKKFPHTLSKNLTNRTQKKGCRLRRKRASAYFVRQSKLSVQSEIRFAVCALFPVPRRDQIYLSTSSITNASSTSFSLMSLNFSRPIPHS